MKRILIIFVKAPVAKRVKTRLTPPLSPEEARDLYECFLLDGFQQYARISNRRGVHLQVHFSPDEIEVRNFFQTCTSSIRLASPIELVPQRGGDLGERMSNALSGAFRSGYEQAVVIGSDHPTLPDACIVEAYDRLSEPSCDAVLGKTNDGGYYLIGMKTLLDCFQNIAWSTETVFSETLKQLEGKSVYQLPEWYDVDDMASLMRCASEIRTMVEVPSHTAAYLESLQVLKAS